MNKILTLAVVMASVLATVANAQSERSHIRDSYRLYNDSNYAGAQEASVKAMAENPMSYEANFNYADALFKQDKVDEALEQFEKMAAAETDKARLSELYHNIGNGYYAKGEFDKSIEAYKKSLRADPTNDATRYNLVAAQHMRNNQDEDQDKKQNQQQQQQQQQDQQQQNQQQQQQQQQNQQQQQMDREEAQRLLDAVQQDENELQEKRKQLKEAQPRRIEKNW